MRTVIATCHIPILRPNNIRNALDAAKASIAINPSCGGQKLIVVERAQLML